MFVCFTLLSLVINLIYSKQLVILYPQTTQKLLILELCRIVSHLHWQNLFHHYQQKCHENATQMPHKCHKNATKGHKNDTKMTQKCHKNATKMLLQKCRKNAAKMPQKCHVNATKMPQKPACLDSFGIWWIHSRINANCCHTAQGVKVSTTLATVTGILPLALLKPLPI